MFNSKSEFWHWPAAVVITLNFAFQAWYGIGEYLDGGKWHHLISGAGGLGCFLYLAFQMIRRLRQGPPRGEQS